MSQDTKKSTLDAILEQHEKNSSTQTSSTNKFDERNYFSTFLPKGVNTGKKTIRILKPKDGSSPFVEVHVHKKQVNGDWKTFACLKTEENKPCPFCEAREALLATGKDSDKEIAKNYSNKKAYVLKVIDREKEADGVKFWRFNHSYKKTGTYDKLIDLIKELGEIYDNKAGRDLTINITRDNAGIPNISSIVHKDPSRLTTDENKVNGLAWINDERTWREVYPVKAYDFLYLIVKGLTPAWDKTNNKWVDKESLKSDNVGNESDELDAELATGKVKTETSTNATANVEDPDNDLPF